MRSLVYLAASSGSPFGAWQAAGAESSAGLPCLKAAIKLKSSSASFTGQPQGTTFCLKMLFS